jgi:alcohol dehydrogenase class IV
VASALGTRDAAAGMYQLVGRLGAERSLAALGMPESGIDSAAKLAVRHPYPNPAKLDYDRIRVMLAAAWAGEPPHPGQPR